jgi:hypothetical protein
MDEKCDIRLDDERRESPTDIGDGGSCANRTPSAFTDALDDIKAALYQHYLASTLSRQDVAQRYHRSRVGPFWLTINMGVLIAALGFVFGALFRAQLDEFLTFICVSMIFWGFISACLNEGCTSFIAAEGIIVQVRIPLFTHVLRSHHRNAIILAHNLLILPLVFLLVGRIPSAGGAGDPLSAAAEHVPGSAPPREIEKNQKCNQNSLARTVRNPRPQRCHDQQNIPPNVWPTACRLEPAAANCPAAPG